MICVLGVDPGPRPGLVCLTVHEGQVIGAETFAASELPRRIADAQLVALERFIIGAGTARRTRGGSSATVEMIGVVRALAETAGVTVLSFPAGAVKPWATDARLAAWGVGVRGDHHRDAARHALYAAVRTGLLPRRPVLTAET